MPAVYVRIYGLNNLQLGLCLLPIAAGGLLVAFVTGKWESLDKNYRRHAKRLGLSPNPQQVLDITRFPIEKARL